MRWNYGGIMGGTSCNSTHNSTGNSTTRKRLIITMITMQRWKGGITNNKKYFSEKVYGKVLTTVKKWQKRTD